MSQPYMASSLPAHQVAELHRLMNEEIREVAVFFTDVQGIITVWNRAAEEMKGYDAEEAIGQPLAMLYTDSDRARGWPAHNLKMAVEDGFYKEENWRKRKDGSLFWARIALTALREPDGELVGFSKITMDLTDHKQLEQCVLEREETRRILRAANAGTWTWRVEKDEVEVSESFLGLIGAETASSTMSFNQWMTFVHPDDRDKAVQRFTSARTHNQGAPLKMELRMCRDDGNCRWFHVHAEPSLGEKGDSFTLSGVNVDIEDMKTTGMELCSAVEKLKETDKRKDEFLAMLAHELRNPMAPIRAAAQLLKTARLDETRVRRISDVIARQLDHMTGLVDDLLDVSRVTRGLVELAKAPLDIRQIVADAVEQVRPLMHARRHQLSLHMPADNLMVLGDYNRMVQVMANLLNNAAKYTPEGGLVEVEVEAACGQITINVTDTGIGIEPELISQVFALFTQAERTPDRSSGGLGVGLSLVQSIVGLHGGTVGCTSEGLGKGSRFSVVLPQLVLKAQDTTPKQDDARANLHKYLRILIVDDNADAAQMLAMLLEDTGHEVMVEYQAHTALERALIEAPDVCLLDIGLPEMDGNELARRLRAEPRTENSILVALTGYGQEQDRKRALTAGFSHYLVKPVEPAQLLSLLETIPK